MRRSDLPFDIIFLDAGRTLLGTVDSVGTTYSGFATRHGVHVDPVAVEQAFRAAFAAQRELSPGAQNRAWWWEIVKGTFARVGVPGEHRELFEELHEFYARPEGWRLFPGAVETLKGLRALGYRTGMISNWDERLPDLLEGLGLAEGLDPVVVSCEVGREKPDPRIFHRALDLAGVAPARALMVGDDEMADIEGATAVGMAALRIDHDADEPPDGVITALPQLLDRLAPA
ncbi:MAG: HAD-IA family hydrolase [Planctomycetota bacterium]